MLGDLFFLSSGNKSISGLIFICIYLILLHTLIDLKE
jgi:hypothetical protein